MADNILTVNERPRGVTRQRARRGARAAAAALPEQYFAPERRYLAQRGPEIARLAAQVKMVTALVNAEKQYYDVSGSSNPVVNPTAQLLTGMAEGDDVQSRSGRSIRAKEIAVRMHFYSASAATTSQTVRVFLVKDNMPNGSAPTVGTLFEGGSPNVDGFPVLGLAQGRFKWLHDETFVLGTLAGGEDAKVISFDLKLDHHVSYVGTSAGAGSAGQGALWLFVLADQVATNASTATYYSRLRFYDN